jgi:hypothetical protein
LSLAPYGVFLLSSAYAFAWGRLHILLGLIPITGSVAPLVLEISPEPKTNISDWMEFTSCWLLALLQLLSASWNLSFF